MTIIYSSAESLLRFGTERQVPFFIFKNKSITNKPIKTTETLFFFNQGHWNNFHVPSCSIVHIINHRWQILLFWNSTWLASQQKQTSAAYGPVCGIKRKQLTMCEIDECWTQEKRSKQKLLFYIAGGYDKCQIDRDCVYIRLCGPYPHSLLWAVV